MCFLWVFFFFLFLGRKSGKGCYIYQPGLKTKEVNPDIGEILDKYRLKPHPTVYVCICQLHKQASVKNAALNPSD